MTMNENWAWVGCGQGVGLVDPVGCSGLARASSHGGVQTQCCRSFSLLDFYVKRETLQRQQNTPGASSSHPT